MFTTMFYDLSDHVSSTPRYLHTYDVIHGGFIAAAQMRAVETDHNQTTVERLEKTEIKAARLSLDQNVVSP